MSQTFSPSLPIYPCTQTLCPLPARLFLRAWPCPLSSCPPLRTSPPGTGVYSPTPPEATTPLEAMLIDLLQLLPTIDTTLNSILYSILFYSLSISFLYRSSLHISIRWLQRAQLTMSYWRRCSGIQVAPARFVLSPSLYLINLKLCFFSFRTILSWEHLYYSFYINCSTAQYSNSRSDTKDFVVR